MTSGFDMTSGAAELRQFVDTNFLFGTGVNYADEDSFLDNGIIDSAGVLELIAHLEERYGLVIADEDLVPENLDSISNVVQFIQRKQTGAVALSTTEI